MYKKVVSNISLMLVCALLLCACGNAAKLTEYDFDTDKVPSVNAVIGEERKVSGVSTGTTNGVRYKQYTYESASVTEDLTKYTTRLRDIGWLVTQDYDLTERKGEAQLAIESADSGKILVMSIAFDSGRYAIRVNKMDGDLTSN